MSAPSPRRRSLTFWDHLAVLLKWRGVVVTYLVIMLIAAVTYALVTQQWYKSSAKLLPPPSGAMGLSAMLPSLASGALGLAGVMSDEVNMILSVLESRDLADAVIEEFDWMEKEDFRFIEEAYDRFDKVMAYEFDEHGLITIHVEETSPQLASETVDFIVNHVKTRFSQITKVQARNQKAFIERRLDQNYADLDSAEARLKAFQRETGMIAPEEQIRVSVESMASVYRELTLAEVQLQVAEATLPPSSPEVLSARTQVDALRDQWEQMRKDEGDEQPGFLLTMDHAPDDAVTYMRLLREIELQSTILEFLLPQFEQARIMEMRENSNIYVLDSGNVPDKRVRPRRAFLVAGWLFAAFVLLYPVLLFLEWLERLKLADPERYAFVQSVLHLLKPANFFRKGRPNAPPVRDDTQAD